VFALIRDEARHATPGAQSIFAKLADVFLAQALRTFLTGAGQTGLLAPGLRPDPPIERAMALMRDQPARPWTVQSLARAAGMSRTSFTTRFGHAVGQSPMQHLAMVRLSQAAGLLVAADRASRRSPAAPAMPTTHPCRRRSSASSVSHPAPTGLPGGTAPAAAGQAPVSYRFSR
jgi:AraC-like DNA-binding protein